MNRRLMCLAIAGMVALGAAHPFAHDEYRIIGTVVKLADSSLQVKARDGKTFSTKLDSETLVYRDSKKVPTTELRAGRYVVVDALGDSEFDLVALEVRIIAALPK